MNNEITTGQLAKQAHVTVRTLQYYDRIGLLKPRKVSEGGRRLYHANDLIVLHQIITLKSVGLSLKDIKERLLPVNNNKDIKHLLSQQTQIIKEQLSKSNKILESIEMISDDIDVLNDVDWEKYSHMVHLIQENNEQYWMMHYLDSDVLDKITKVHEDHTKEEIPTDWLVRYMTQAVKLIENNFGPESDEAQSLAKDLWLIINKYSGGNPEILNKLYLFYSQGNKWPKNYSNLQEKTFTYIQQSIEYYLKTIENRKGKL